MSKTVTVAEMHFNGLPRWRAEVGEDCARILSDTGAVLAYVPADYVSEDGREVLSGEGRAVAKRIGALPDVLEALERAAAWLDLDAYEDPKAKVLIEDLRFARAALAKARGEGEQ